MTPSQLIQSAILEKAMEWAGDEPPIQGPFNSPEKIQAAFEAFEEAGVDDYINDATSEIRELFTHETGIDTDWSQHYESKSVAREIKGQWVGWTYWYGGGKHSDPSEIDWIEDAYFVEVKAVPKVVMEFTKK